jgi:hypothetical protein
MGLVLLVELGRPSDGGRLDINSHIDFMQGVITDVLHIRRFAEALLLASGAMIRSG